jgi:MFS family permease
MSTFGVLWVGQLITILGSGLTSFSLGVWTYEKTGSVTEFGLITLCAVAPLIVLAPLAGVLVDRWDRRRVMIASDSVAALSTLTLLFLHTSGQLELWHVYIGVCVSSIASAFQESAFNAAITLLVDERHLNRASGMMQLAQAAGRTLAPPLAGALFVTWGLRAAMVLDLATFLFAIGTELAVRIPAPPPSEEGDRARQLGWRSNLSFGWRYIVARPALLSLLGFFFVVNFTLGLAEVLVTPLVLRMEAPDRLGWVLGFCGLGMIAGSGVMSVWGGPRKRVHAIAGAGVLYGVCLMLAGLQPSLLLVTAAGFGMMFFNPPMGACSQSVWQSTVPAALQGRVFAVRMAVCWSSMPVAYMLGGPLADRVFEPLLLANGPLASSVGVLLGVGPGRGIALLLIVLGLMAMLASAALLMSRPARELGAATRPEPTPPEPAVSPL